MKRIWLLLFLLAPFPLLGQSTISPAQIFQFTPGKPVGNPPFNGVYMYFDSTTGILTCLNSSGTNVCSGSSGNTGSSVDCSQSQYNPGGSNTWDVILANCIAGTATHDGATWNMTGVRGTQTIGANPLQALVGYGGFAPLKAGVVQVGAGNYTLNQDLVIPSGIRFECSSPHGGGAQSTEGCNLLPNMPSLYNTGTVSTTAIACPSGANACTSTWTFSGAQLQANQVGERAMVCTTTTTGTLACPSGATGGALINEGLILSVNTTANTAVVLVDRSAEGNANTSVNYAIYPAFVQLGDNSVAYTPGCTAGTCTVSAGSNFNLYFGGFGIDNTANAVTGGIALFNRSASNETGLDNTVTIIPYDGPCLYIGGPGSQNSGPYGSEHAHWCTSGTTGSHTTQHTAQGIIVRSTGAPPVHIANFAVALAGAKNGSTVTGIDTCGFCIGSPTALGPGIKVVLQPSGYTTSIGVDVNHGATCYVACEDPEWDSSGGSITNLTSTTCGAEAVHLGNTTAALTGYNVWSINNANSPASCQANLLVDDQNSVSVPYNDSSSNTLDAYQIDANGKSRTTAKCAGCNTAPYLNTGTTGQPAVYTASNAVGSLGGTINVKAFGATGNTQTVTDASITSGLNALTTSSSTKFAAGDVGKVIQVMGAGAAGATLVTTIATFVSSSSVTLTANAGTTVGPSASVFWGTDDTTAIQNAINAFPNGGTVYFPAGTYTTTGLTLTSGVSLTGESPQATIITNTVPIVAAGGTWINCSSTNCLTGNSMTNVNLSHMGFENFIGQGILIGGNNQNGLSFANWEDLSFTCSQTVNSCDTAIKIYNFQHLAMVGIRADQVNTCINLINQSSGIQGGNSEFVGFYCNTYGKSAANGNAAKPGIWVQTLTPSSGTAQIMDYVSFFRPQVNSYNGDGTGINVSVNGISGHATTGIGFYDSDIEGNYTSGFYVDYTQASYFGVLKTQNSSAGTLFNFTANSSDNVIASADGTANFAFATTRNNFLSGIFAANTNTGQYGCFTVQAGNFQCILNGPLQMAQASSSLPTCSSTTRGSLYLDTTSTPDVLLQCDRTGAGTYAWKDIAGITLTTAADVTCGTGGTISSCTTFQTITGLTAGLSTLVPNWTFDCDLIVSQATAAAADQIGVQTATNGATSFSAAAIAYTAAGTATAAAITDVGSTTTAQSVVTLTPGATGTKLPLHVWGTITGASTSGTTFNLQVLTGAAADLLTIYEGSKCTLK